MDYWIMAGGFISGMIIGFVVALLYRKSLIQKNKERPHYADSTQRDRSEFSQIDKVEKRRVNSVDGSNARDEFK